MTLPTVPLTVEADHPDLVVGIVVARGVHVGPCDAALDAEVESVLARVRAAAEHPPQGVKDAIRDLLRRGGYKPTGRGKPASEYLANAAARGEFPRINNVVDACNVVSLDTGLPISLLDLDLAMEGAPGLVIRLGRDGESYVFNSAGHEIDVEGLLCVARDGGPCLGNAVKDGMASKIRPETRNVLAVVWSSARVAAGPALEPHLRRMAALFGAPAEVEIRTG